MSAIRCLRATCPWTLAPGHLYCGLCGQRAGTCELDPPDVVRGLVFYPRAGGDPAREFRLVNRGRVAVPATLRTSPGYEFIVGGARQPQTEMRLTLPQGDSWRIRVQPRGRFPGQDEYLEIETPVADVACRRIPLLSSHPPTWDLVHDGQRLECWGGRAPDLYPPADRNAEATWTLQLGPLGGAGIFEGARAIEGGDALHLSVPPGRRLMQPGDRIPLKVEWTAASQPTAVAIFELDVAGQPPRRFMLKAHREPPVALSSRLLSPRDDATLYIGGRRPAKVVFSLSNVGGQPARIQRLRCLTPGVEVVEVQLDRTTWDCRGALSLPRAAQKAFLRGVTPRPVPDEIEWLETFTLAVGRDAAPADGVLSAHLEAEIFTGAGGQDLPQKLEFTLTARARRIRDLAPHEGRLLIDYGTVHTCARLLLETQGSVDPGLIELEHHPEGDETPYELKSCYQVRDWQRGPQLRFGRTVWQQIPTFISQTDFAAKLRLGTDVKRPLRDDNGVLKMVSGEQAAAYYLEEVLDRVAEQTGYRARALWMTRPAAFGRDANGALVRAAERLGHATDAIELRCTEPEAYLCALASDDGFRRSLDEIAQRDGRQGRRPLLGFVFDFGGGTTDVTLFHAVSGRARAIEIVASHGYRWLGGEALTIQIAAHLFSLVPDNARFPFPKITPGTHFDLDQLDRDNAALQGNFAHMRQAAERLKCSDDWSGRIALNLHDGERPFIEHVEVVQGDRTRGVLGVVWQMVARAIEDILERVVRMSSHRILRMPVPQVVAVAGNSGRLWCLERIVRETLRDAGAEDILYHFEPTIAKTGVVDGLSVYRRGATRVGIKLREADPHWWYARIGVKYHLAKPGGAARPKRLSSEGLVKVLDEPVQAWGAFELFTGHGPELVLSADAGRRLRRAGLVHAPEFEGELVELAFGFDPGGHPGLWLNRVDPFEDEPGDDWQFFAATPQAVQGEEAR